MTEEEPGRSREKILEVSDQPAPPSQEEIDKLLTDFSEVEAQVLYQDEAGLFHHDRTRNLQERIHDHLRDGRLLARSGQVDSGRRHLNGAEALFHEALHRRSTWWKLHNVHQIYIFLYYIVALILLLNVGSGWLQSILPSLARTVWGVPVEMLGLGALGGVLRGLWWLWKKVARRTARPQFLLAYLGAPWIGALLGFLVVLLLQAGLGAAQLARDLTAMEEAAGTYLLAFLAGFSWKWVVDWAEQVLRSISGQGPNNDSE